MTYIFHLAEQDRWRRATSRNEIYFSPTFDQDGLTHAAPDMAALVKVANQFYRQQQGPWLVLTMEIAHLQRMGVDLRFEPASPVGHQTEHFAGSATLLFPHIYGGLTAQMVLREDALPQSAGGWFKAIDVFAE